jgi:type III secretion system YscQ/HrcQ family protein
MSEADALAGGALIQRTAPGETKRGNALFGLRRSFPFAWAGKPARLRFIAPAAAPAPLLHLTAELGGHPVQIGLPGLPEPASLGVAFAGIEIAGLPEEILLGVMEAWLADAMKAASSAGVAWRLTGYQATPPTLASACGWEVAREANERFLVGSLHAEPAVLDAIVGSVSRVPAQPLGKADAVPVALHVVVARVPLSLSALRTVSLGDVFLVALPPGSPPQGPCELWAGTRLVGRALRNQQSFRVTAMNPPVEPAAKAPAGPVKVDDLPVSVLFDLGQLDLTVGQLRTVAEGFTFELAAMPPRLVAIRVGGREVGQGELVEVGDKVGVRVVQWTLS